MQTEKSELHIFSNSHGASLKDHEKESSLKLKGIVASNPSLSFAENLSQRKIDSRGSSWSLVWSTRSSPSSQELFARVRNASSRWAVSVETLPLWGFGLSSWECMAKGSRKSAQFSAEVRWFLCPLGSIRRGSLRGDVIRCLPIVWVSECGYLHGSTR